MESTQPLQHDLGQLSLLLSCPSELLEIIIAQLPTRDIGSVAVTYSTSHRISPADKPNGRISSAHFPTRPCSSWVRTLNIDWAPKACGGFHMIGLLHSGDVVAWGRAFSDEEPLDTTHFALTVDECDQFRRLYRRINLPDSPRVVQVCAGRAFDAVLTATGDVYAWSGARKVAKLCSGARQIAAGWTHLAAVCANDHLLIWNDISDPDDDLLCEGPIKLPNVSQIACGEKFTLALTSDGHLWRLALGSNEAIPVEFPVNKAGNETLIRHISACYQNSAAISQSDDQVFLNVHAEGGHLQPRLDLCGKKIVQIGFGDWFGLALSESGLVYSWGESSHGATSVKRRREVALPIENVAMPSFIQKMTGNPYFVFQIAAGGWHSALLACGDPDWASKQV